jgi:hypothetical protein
MNLKKISDYVIKGTSAFGATIAGLITKDIMAINNKIKNEQDSEFRNKFLEIAAGVAAAVVGGLVIYTGLKGIYNKVSGYLQPEGPAVAPAAANQHEQNNYLQNNNNNALAPVVPKVEDNPAPRYSLRTQIKKPQNFTSKEEYDKYYKNKGNHLGQ